MKICSKCNEPKSEDDFGKKKHGANGLNSWCRPCTAKSAQAYRDANPALARSNTKRYYDADPRRHKSRYLKKKYGISIEEYDAMALAQDGCCAICKRAPIKDGPKVDRVLHVDHDHKTGRIRGLLCGRCNKMLGLAHDTISVLRVAIEYLCSPR